MLKQPLNVTPDVILFKVAEFSLTQATQIYGCSELINSMILQRKDSLITLHSTKACTYENSSNPILYQKDPCCNPEASLTMCCAPRTIPYKAQRISQFNRTFIDQQYANPLQTETFVYNYYRQYIEVNLPVCQAEFNLFSAKINAYVEALTRCSNHVGNIHTENSFPTSQQVNDYVSCWIDALPKSAIRNVLSLMGRSIHDEFPSSQDSQTSRDSLIALFKEFMLNQYGQENCEDSNGKVGYGYSQEECEKQVCNVDPTFALVNCTGHVCASSCKSVLFGNSTFCAHEESQFTDQASCEEQKACYYYIIDTLQNTTITIEVDTSITNAYVCESSGKCSHPLCQDGTCSQSKCESMGVCENFPTVQGKFTSLTDLHCVYAPLMTSDGKNILCKNNDTLSIIGCITDKVEN